MPGNGHKEGVITRNRVSNARTDGTGGSQRITECNCAYNSLHYVLLFP